MLAEADLEACRFQAEYPGKGFGILRLVSRSNEQLGLMLRPFEDPNHKQDYPSADGSVSLIRLKQIATEMQEQVISEQ